MRRSATIQAYLRRVGVITLAKAAAMVVRRFAGIRGVTAPCPFFGLRKRPNRHASTKTGDITKMTLPFARASTKNR
jgi:hypothetical protein